MKTVFTAVSALLVLFCVSSVFGDLAELHLLTDAVKDGAMCIDGSPAGYYYAPGSGTGVNKWLVYHEGGGWCASYQDCYARSLTDLGSSKHYPPSANLGGGYFDSNPAVNPMMYNWNKVYMKYCDGGSFSGDAVSSYTNGPVKAVLNFKGTAVRTAMRDSLLALGLKSATDMVVTGCSAGGLATYLHADWWHDAVPSTTHVVGLPDSGFFIDYESTGARYESQMQWVYSAMNVKDGVDADCVDYYKNSQLGWRCMFAQYTSPFIETPIFAMQSEFDSWQIPYILASDNGTLINIYGKNLTEIITANLTMSPTKANGVFLDSCFHHCGAWGIHIDGKNQADAFSLFYNQPSAAHSYIQDKEFPCQACCSAATTAAFSVIDEQPYWSTSV